MIDKNLQFCSGQTVTAAAISTYNVDIAPYRDIWAGQPLYVRVGWSGTLATATTVNVQLLASIKPILWPNGTAVTVTNTGNIVTLAAHGLVAGTDVYFASYGGAGLVNGTVYYVTNPTTNTFQLASTEALALAGTADIDPDADDASVTMSHYTATLASTGAVDIARWNVLKQASLVVPQISGAADQQTFLLSGPAAGSSSKWRYLALNFVVAGSNLSGATVSAHIDIVAPDSRKFYPSAITVA